MKLKRNTLVSPNALSRMLEDANRAWQRKDFERAIAGLERASRLDPANCGVLRGLGQMYGLRYDYAAAERCFEKVVRIAPNKADMLLGVGKQSFDFGAYELAERYLRRVIEQNNSSAEALVRLGEVYERVRRLDDAAAAADRALTLNASSAPALLLRARLYRQAGQAGDAERLLRSCLQVKPEPTLGAQAWCELGALLDRQGAFDEAMNAFLAAKELLIPLAAPALLELQTIRERLQALRTGLSAELLHQWFDAAPGLAPTRRLVLLGGHPRSGTTLLEQVLDSHPDMVSLEETTVFYDDAYMPLTRGRPDNDSFLSVVQAASPSALQHARAGYFRTAEQFLRQPIGSRLLMDKNPSLTFLIPLLIRIFPEIKLLIALRDPRDVCLSCFMQYMPLTQGSAAYLSLEATVEDYTALMGMWTTIAPLIKNPFLEVRYEDMVEALEPVARRTLDFLGISWDARVLGFDEHARQKVVRSPTYADVAKPIYKSAVGRWRNYQKHLEPYLQALAPFAQAFGYES
ncbi:MAG TPA: sulfotransferase [Verrucomicrobiae bacterium]|nr:sulfotransferase [Verrucomicrobiae bacterium]